jgi:hypothetical protein
MFAARGCVGWADVRRAKAHFCQQIRSEQRGGVVTVSLLLLLI